MKSYFFILCLTVTLQQAVQAQVVTDQPEDTELFESYNPIRIGWVEKVLLTEDNFLVHAKLDTGADYCSLHATKISFFEKEKQKWVKFTLHNRFGDTKELERRVIRTADIKRAGGKTSSRPVVQLTICLANKMMQVDVNLIDRSTLSYGMLIGRNFLASNVLVDASSTYLFDPKCE